MKASNDILDVKEIIMYATFLDEGALSFLDQVIQEGSKPVSHKLCDNFLKA